MSGAQDGKERSFRSLIEAEEQRLGTAEAALGRWQIAPPGSADEPWVNFTPKDRVGLAFSGGGIRSATFNLGLLQGLQRLKLLRHFDYLATVSGGGYIGAWWSAWLARRKEGEGLFPGYDHDEEPLGHAHTAGEETREPDEVRHLREFSNFLSPRIGFFETEMWAAVLAVMSAMLPGLLVANTVLALGILLSLGLAMVLMAETAPFGLVGAAAFSVLLIFGVQFFAERTWCGKKKAEAHTFPPKWWLTITMVGTVVLLLGWLAVGYAGPFGFPPAGTWLSGSISHADWAGGRIWSNFGVERESDFRLNPQLFHVPLAWVTAGFFLILLRIAALRVWGNDPQKRVYLATADRALQRVFAAALVWALIAAIWATGAFLYHRGLGGVRALLGAMISSALFALLRNWFVSQLATPKTSGFFARLKPLLPQLLSYLTVLMGTIAVAAALAAGLDRWGWAFWVAGLVGALVVLGLCIVGFDPALVSMHAFYRNRLARAYLGASNPDARSDETPRHHQAGNRHVDLRLKDDLLLRDLHSELPKPAPEVPQTMRRGPLHLVCCAANDLAGDELSTLARGSRSAVLSPVGFSIGEYWQPWTREPAANVTVASAITASAAAFNSNMGSVSMALGPAVTFLMTTLNLRLGLWLKHPLVPGNLGRFPGLLFLWEMFSYTRCGPPVECEGKPVPASNYVHLSDGAHFENLALYELVRRHCRYIIVSDCGADATVAFDDFGNAMRRIREDFGVEIDINLEPIRPDPVTGLSTQHMVVGSIYYNRERSDIGILLYFKPTVTNDEPCDVTQYRTRNVAFPHESTGDQFYDESQWESYRRLGEHVAGAALRFVQRFGKPLGKISADEFFVAARQEWYPAPIDLAERVVAAMDRIGELADRLRDHASPALRRELFPELHEIGAKLQKISAKPEDTKANESAATEEEKLAAADAPTMEEIEQNLPFVLEVFRTMQSIWLSCYFETHWSHPLNLGLFNAFQRFAYAPSCRLWWPLLRPMYGSRFRRFVHEHLALGDDDHPKVEGYIKGRDDEAPDGLAWTHWLRSRPPKSPPPKGSKFYEYVIVLPVQMDRQTAVRQVEIQLGIVALQQRGGVVRWSSEDFFVPPSLWGSGTGGRFLGKLLDELAGVASRIVVQLKQRGDRQQSDFSSRQERNDLVTFYGGRGFALRKKTDKMVLERERLNER